ncbi:MAG TPA: lysophospholipid acyltransferase family protein [Rhizomicrobium sp.]|nr:lysophospholipid acyltransferase family protein [Rhizomicrobium sp.]
MTIFRSAIFILWFSLISATLALVFLPAFLLPRSVTVWMAHCWTAASFWGLKVICGLDYEVRGEIPPPGRLVAVKHMSMWDTMAIHYLLRDPIIVLKRQLLYVPFYGWYLKKTGMISVNREGGANALRRMTDLARQHFARGHTVVIFPEGTRKQAGAPPDYKPGVAALYAQLDVECIPAALNSGLFWTGFLGFLKKRGKIVIEFLKPIPPGLKRREFMARLETEIEDATRKLIAEGRLLLAK